MSQILPNNISDQAFLAAEIIIIVVPTLFVALRLATNIAVHKRLWIDDYLSVLALFMLTTIAVFYYEEIIKLDNPATTLTWIGNVIASSSFIAVFGSYTAKAPILIMYVRIFGVKAWLRHICYAVLAMDFLFALGPGIYIAVKCSPNRSNLNLAWLDSCVNVGLAIGVFNGTVSVITDLIIFILPLPVIGNLQLPTSRKIGLFAVFAVGFLGLVASTVTLYYRATSLAAKGTSANEVGQMLGQSIELSIAIMVGCVPAIRAFWATYLLNMPFYSKIMSSFSTRKSTSQSQSLPVSKEGPYGASTERIVPSSSGDSGRYYELQNPKKSGSSSVYGV